MNTAPIVSRIRSFCATLRDDGVSYGDYLEQLTYLIFLKMADEYGRPPYCRDVGIPDAYDWKSLKTKRGAELTTLRCCAYSARGGACWGRSSPRRRT